MTSNTYYKKAEIYLTECIHPDYSHLRYLGLDTKCDPNYLGSSVTLKWWINYLGRRYFTKSILETVSGTMAEVCRVEQQYILEHDAVKSPNYFNMNGGKQNASVEDLLISMDYFTQTNSYLIKCVVQGLAGELPIRNMTGIKRMLVSHVICMAMYGYLKYEQETFEYSVHQHYCGCHPEDFQEILGALASLEVIDFDSNHITIQETLKELIPVGTTPKDFKVLAFE